MRLQDNKFNFKSFLLVTLIWMYLEIFRLAKKITNRF